jgi:excinuclease ABC subunit A
VPTQADRANQGNGEVPWLVVRGAAHNNLKNIDVALPLGRFTCVTGVSGSGKSSLVDDILYAALARQLNKATTVQPGKHLRIDGLEHLDKVIAIDQSPIGRTPRSNPVTYIKVFDEIRALFTRLPDAKLRGYKPGRFSFNVPAQRGGGRCEACEGNGANRVEMDFLADVWVTCPVCAGRRFARETLQVRYGGRAGKGSSDQVLAGGNGPGHGGFSIADVLELDIREALALFENVPRIRGMLQTLHDVGLDYIKLGQPSTTLSGGEAQRIKLARELVKKSTGRTLYVLDEPTTGLHFDDIGKLLTVLHGFVDAGNTVVVIEHNLDVIKTADWVVDLGPEGGEQGGGIVVAGTPEEIAACEKSYTGVALREVLFEKPRGHARDTACAASRVRATQPPRTGAEGPRDRGVEAWTRAETDAAAAGAGGTKSPFAVGRSPFDIHDSITVIGARQHNLKDITVSFPRNRLTVCTGVSGSGKTSFAIDTVFTEGYRRYVESLSAYARQFLGQMAKPRVEHVHGLSPAICIEQKAASKSPRSTVGTITEVYDYMRVLWARVGTPYCPRCQVPVGSQTVDEIVDRIMGLEEEYPIAIGEVRKESLSEIRGPGNAGHAADFALRNSQFAIPIIILAPVVLGDGESYATLFSRLKNSGYVRVRIDGEIRLTADATTLDARRRHRVEVVVDRTIVRARARSRIAESVEHALALGNGVMTVLVEAVETIEESHAAGPSSPAQEEEPRASARAEDGALDPGRYRVSRTPARELMFSQKLACTRCGTSFEELGPHHFSFNSHLGWCETCEGLGVQRGAPAGEIIKYPARSLFGGAIAGWGHIERKSPLGRLLAALCHHLGVEPDAPLRAWTPVQKRVLMFGNDRGAGPPSSAQTANFGSPSAARSEWLDAADVFPGVHVQWRGFFPTLDAATRNSWMLRHRLHSVVTDIPCVTCRGGRLRPDAAAVRLGDRTIVEVCEMPLGDAAEFFRTLALDERRRQIAGELLKEIRARLQFLVDVGLDYLTLHRAAPTLSGGEAQRIRLASQIGSGLSGVLYVLDEPTIGLHPRDNLRLISALYKLRNLGNTLLIVEHDRDVIRHADRLLDFGPRAGAAGGYIVAQGTPAEFLYGSHETVEPRSPAGERGPLARESGSAAATGSGTDGAADPSLTRAYLGGAAAIPIPSNRRPVGAWEGALRREAAPSKRRTARRARMTAPASSLFTPSSELSTHDWLVVRGARQNNLKSLDVPIPLGRFTCVTGVSGSGKSSLVNDILWPALAVKLHRATLTPGEHDGMDGVRQLDKVINVDQSPIGGTPSSNPATYTGAFDWIRELFARLPESKLRGYNANRFSFNRPGGRCEACEGYGQKCIEMHFMPDVWVECETCHGRRYNPETLEVRFKGKNIADVLDLRVSEALELFANVPKVRRMLQTLADVGLNYVQLGQPAPTLSGGEAQRVRLAAELGKPDTGRTFYILDEPTTGLHFDDVRKLLAVIHRLVDLGNTVLVVEHNLDVIKSTDWIIDLGPEAGDAGGYIVALGTPEEIVQSTELRVPIKTMGDRPPACRATDQRSVPQSDLLGALRVKKVKCPATPDNADLALVAGGPHSGLLTPHSELLTLHSELSPVSHTAAALKPILEAGPYEERKPYDPAAHAARELEVAKAGFGQVGREVRMPWQVDGRRWHLEQRTSREGQPRRWEAAALEYVIDLVQRAGQASRPPQAGPFAPTNWNERASVEITAPDAPTWFLHALTGGEWLLELYFLVPPGVFKWRELDAALGLQTLDEREDLQTYGDWARVDVRPRQIGMDAVVIYVHDKQEIDTSAFRKFVRQAARAYLDWVAAHRG